MELPSLEQQIKEARQCYSEIHMFDYGLGKMSNQQAIADFYGWEIVDQILYEIEYSYNHKLDDRKSGQISKKLWQRMKDIRAGRLPKAERKKYNNQCKRKDGGSDIRSAGNQKTNRTQKKSRSQIIVKQRDGKKVMIISSKRKEGSFEIKHTGNCLRALVLFMSGCGLISFAANGRILKITQ